MDRPVAQPVQGCFVRAGTNGGTMKQKKAIEETVLYRIGPTMAFRFDSR